MLSMRPTLTHRMQNPYNLIDNIRNFLPSTITTATTLIVILCHYRPIIEEIVSASLTASTAPSTAQCDFWPPLVILGLITQGGRADWIGICIVHERWIDGDFSVYGVSTNELYALENHYIDCASGTHSQRVVCGTSPASPILDGGTGDVRQFRQV